MNTSVRKHCSQMSDGEIKTVLNFAKKIPKQEWGFNGYTFNRIQERGGTKDYVLNALQNGELIEYHLKENKSRILVRGTQPISEYHRYVPCVVFELKTKTVITVYWNHVDDNHRTINMKPYDENLNVIKNFIQND